MLEIFGYFLRLGCVGFGGPLALVAHMQQDLIDDRRWISKGEFIQALALIKSMPGPLAFSVATYLGYRRRGFWGGTLAGWGLVLPAAVMMLVIVQLYDRFVEVKAVSKALTGMQAAALALIILSIPSLLRGYEKNILFWVLTLAALGLTAATPVPEPMIILGFGLLAIFLQSRARHSVKMLSIIPFFPVDERVLELFWICFKSGAVVFGTGLAIVPLLEIDFVEQMHWVTHSEFMTALAFGQMTPGPVLITVTFVGFKVAGYLGAAVATIAVFLPSYVHMTTWFPKVSGWLGKKIWISNFILGALAAVIATLIYVTFKLCSWNPMFQNVATLGFVIVSLKWKVPSWKLIVMGAGVGLLM